jgi:hypothetical protein
LKLMLLDDVCRKVMVLGYPKCLDLPMLS